MDRQTLIPKVEKAIGFYFRSTYEDLIWAALQSETNENMSTSGALVLSLVVVGDLMDQGAGDDQASMAHQVQNIMTPTRIGAAARNADIDECVILPADSDGRVDTPTVVAVLQAIIWAVYVASGRNVGVISSVLRKLDLWMPGEMGK